MSGFDERAATRLWAGMLRGADDPALAEDEALVVGAVEVTAPSAAARERLLDAAAGRVPRGPRRHADRLAELLDVSSARARAFVRRLSSPDGWEDLVPGVARLLHLPGGPATVGAEVGFVDVIPGADFPVHLHEGVEHNLVLAGQLEDLETGEVHLAGDAFTRPGGSVHRFRSGPEGLTFAVVVRGVSFDLPDPAGPGAPD